jgi:hypothetical protein
VAVRRRLILQRKLKPWSSGWRVEPSRICLGGENRTSGARAVEISPGFTSLRFEKGAHGDFDGIARRRDRGGLRFYRLDLEGRLAKVREPSRSLNLSRIPRG